MRALAILALSLGCSCIVKERAVQGPPGTPGKDADSSLETRVVALEQLYSALNTTVNLMGANVTATNARIEDLELINSTYDSAFTDIYTRLTALEVSSSTSTSQLTAILADVSVLQSIANNQVVQAIDPCGDGAGSDEILLKLASGEIISYYDSRGDRYLVRLASGNYETRDAQECEYTVSAGGVTW